MSIALSFQLEVRQIQAICQFRLAWKQRQLLVEVTYPEELEAAYECWQAAYLNFYLLNRAQVVKSGSIHEPKDRRSLLILAEDQLRSHFQQWLRHPNLHDLQAEIVAATKSLKEDQENLDIFLTCSKNIARLPWESWEVGTDPEAAARVRFARSFINIKQCTAKPIRRQTQILVIAGTAPELLLDQDLAVIKHQLPKTVKVTVLQAEQDKTAAEHLLDIQRILQDSRGWDMLFFAGHSGESTFGGQLGLAPQVSIQVNELQESLEVARRNGLQFAFFNSCNGLEIAETLIKSGIGQVIVMREPLPDAAAPIFLTKFLDRLAQYQDVHSALLSACQNFSKQIQYPSLSLVPSLFRHPNSQLFRIQPYGLKNKLQRWLPTRSECRWLAFLLLFSLIPVVQDLMLEPRILFQAIYQQTTGQNPKQESSQVLLVEIDDISLQKTEKKLIKGRYLNYSYLAELLDRLSERKSKVIGIDYILDQDAEQPQNSGQLKAAIQKAKERGTQLVFGGYEEKQAAFGISDKLLPSEDYKNEGDLKLTEWIVALPKESTCKNDCPFAYQLARTFTPENKALEHSVLHPVSKKSHAIFQNWFEPIIDFSVPEQTAYDRVSACSIVGSCPSQLARSSLENQVVLITHGGYKKGGLYTEGDDIYAQPLARSYLATQKKASDLENFLGGEAHAYSIHHLLLQHLVIPIPNLFMTLLVVVFSKGVMLFRVNHPEKDRQILSISAGGTLIYIFFSLQLYVSAAILMPIGFPLLTYWLYMSLGNKRRNFRV